MSQFNQIDQYRKRNFFYTNFKIYIAPMRKGPTGYFSKTEKERQKELSLSMQMEGVIGQRNFYSA